MVLYTKDKNGTLITATRLYLEERKEEIKKNKIKKTGGIHTFN